MSEKPTKTVFTAEKQRRSNGSAGGLDSSGISNAELMHAINVLAAQMGANGAAGSNGAGANGSGGNCEAGEQAAPAADSNGEFAEVDARMAVAEMVRSIANTQSEIAAITHPKSDDDQIKSASSELDAIVKATETATEEILQAAENIGQAVDSIATICSDNKDVMALTDQVAQQILVVFQACGFQDITGQRIEKIVKNIQFVKERILAIIEIWGPEAFADLPVPVAPAAAETEGEVLSGPQLENQGISQEEIDALLA